MEENKKLFAEQADIEPGQPAENIPKEIFADESAMPELEAAAIHQPQTTNLPTGQAGNKPETGKTMEVRHHYASLNTKLQEALRKKYHLK